MSTAVRPLRGPGAIGRMRRYRTWWANGRPRTGRWTELVSRPRRSAQRRRRRLAQSGPVEYRVRPSGHGGDAWRPLVFGPGELFGPGAGAAAYAR
jgi:hypothetical protein